MSAPAEAACVNGSTDPCDSGGVPVCVLGTTSHTNDTVDCRLDANGSTTNANVYAVSDGNVVEVFGLDAGNNTFCCQYSPNSSYDTLVAVTGSSNNDSIALWYDDGSTHYDLEPVHGVGMHASVLGAEGNDDIEGSFIDVASYLEWLQGGDGVDTIDGNDGEDYLNGGDGGDTLKGGNGDDIVEGSGGADTISGNAGDDVLYGDGTTPYTYPDTDTINGNEGDDLICGGATSSSSTPDALFGDDGNDTIWGAVPNWSPYYPLPAQADIDGGTQPTGGGDECDNTLGSTQVNCETLITTDPGCW